MEVTFERIVEFEPAFDKRNADPHKNYGIHGVNLRMLLRGADGVVQFLLYTGWMLPHVEKELDARRGDHLICHPQPVDLGYHSPKPVRDWQDEKATFESCEYLDGGPCWYDGSSLSAQRVYDRLVAEGHEGVWAELEDYYRAIFSSEEEIRAGEATV
jgi:hypothetical protein